MGLGIASSPVPLGRLSGTVGWTHFALELAGEVSTSSTFRRTDGSGFSQQEIFGSVAGCGVRRPWSACLVAKFGELRVDGQGIDVPTTATAFMAQTGLRLAVTHSLGGRFVIAAHADGLALLTRGIVKLDSVPVWTTPRLGAALGADIGIQFR